MAGTARIAGDIVSPTIGAKNWVEPLLARERGLGKLRKGITPENLHQEFAVDRQARTRLDAASSTYDRLRKLRGKVRFARTLRS
jgi:hypothetical protein